MFYDIQGNVISDMGGIEGAFPTFNSGFIYTNENPTGIFASANDVIAAYDALFDGENVQKVLRGYATTANGGQDTTRPIYSYELSNPVTASEMPDAPKVLMTAGVHGDEPTAVLGLYNLIKSMMEHTDSVAAILRDSLSVSIMPLINPWGYDNYKRNNAHGVNINRNFSWKWSDWADSDKGTAPYSEYETQAVMDWIDATATGALFHIDWHNMVTSANLEFWLPSSCEKMQRPFSVVARNLRGHFYAQGIEINGKIRQSSFNSSPALTPEFFEVLGIDSATLETPNARGTNAYIRRTVEFGGNYIYNLLKNYLWNPT